MNVVFFTSNYAEIVENHASFNSKDKMNEENFSNVTRRTSKITYLRGRVFDTSQRRYLLGVVREGL